MSSQIIVQPLGIITQPNKLGSTPPGSMVQGVGYIRSPGTFESAVDWQVIGNVSSSLTSPIMYVKPIGIQSLTLYTASSGAGGWSYCWFNHFASTVTTASLVANGINQYISTTGRFGWSTSGEKTIVSCAIGNVVFDYKSPTSTAERAPRMAGMYPPVSLVVFAAGSYTSTGIGALRRNKQCAVITICRRTFSDGREIVSAPSNAIFARSALVDPDDGIFENIRVDCALDTRLHQVGDAVEIYRTRSQDQPEANFGSDYYLSKTVILSATDISNTYISVYDTTPDESLSVALYTNDGVQGSESAAFVPPTCTCISSFRGHTFYLNTTDAPFFKVRSPVVWGQMFPGSSSGAKASAYGGMSSVLSCSTSSGSPVITGLTSATTDYIAIGQRVFASAGFSQGLTIVTFTATTITVDFNAASTVVGTVSLSIVDVLELDGTKYAAANDINLLQNLSRDYQQFNISRQILEVDSSWHDNPSDFLVITKKNFWGNPATSTNYTLTARATRGHLLEPPLPRIETSETAKTFTAKHSPNGFRWSEENQPENCPATNAAFCGAGEIYAAVATRDALWIFASDGLWRLSGTGGQAGRGYDWRIDPVDSTLIISSPQAICVLRDNVYAMTSRGLVRVDSGGNVVEVSHGKVDDTLSSSTWREVTWASSTAVFLIPDEKNNEVVIREYNDTSGQMWRYNEHTDSFTKDSVGSAPIHGAFSDYADSPIVAGSSSNGRLYVLNPGTYQQFSASFQPVFASSPFDMHHWQTVNLSFEGAATGVNVYLNESVTPIGTRTVTTAGTSAFSRTSFGVPRAAPAVSNNIQVMVTATSASAALKLQGIELVHEQLSGQRKVR